MNEIQPTEHAEIEQHRQGFTREQVELVKRTVAQGVNDDELALFLETSKRRGLDPFSGQIHAVMRWDSRAGRDVMKIQTGIDGYRKIADETGLVEYVRGPEFTADGDTWTDTWLRENPPAAARFYVKRRDRSREEHRVVRWVEFVQTKRDGSVVRSWSDMPTVMLGKVAEAHALRAAFPEQLGGIYTADEMDQASSGAPAQQPEPEVDQVEERRELFERFRAAWPTLTDEDRTAVWEQHGSRLWGDGDDPLAERFRSTPTHVLADLVDAAEAAVPDEDDGGEEPEPDTPMYRWRKGVKFTRDEVGGLVGWTEEEVARFERGEVDLDPTQRAAFARAVGARIRDVFGEPPDDLDDPEGGPAPDPDPQPDDDQSEAAEPERDETEVAEAARRIIAESDNGDEFESAVRDLARNYDELTVVDVGQLLRTGEVSVEAGEGQGFTLTLPKPPAVGFRLIDELEGTRGQRLGGDVKRRKTVDASLEAVDWRPGSWNVERDESDADASDPEGDPPIPEEPPTDDTGDVGPASGEADRLAPDDMDDDEIAERRDLWRRFVKARHEVAVEAHRGVSGAQAKLDEIDEAKISNVGADDAGWLHTDLDAAREAVRVAEEGVPF